MSAALSFGAVSAMSIRKKTAHVIPITDIVIRHWYVIIEKREKSEEKKMRTSLLKIELRLKNILTCIPVCDIILKHLWQEKLLIA
jgi:glycerol-3-phosphate cytidylyltransferase-like family protein